MSALRLVPLTLRQFGSRLGLLALVGLLGISPWLIAAFYWTIAGSETDLPTAAAFADGVFRNFGLPLLYPVMALLLCAPALRDEISDGTVPYLWTKPIARPAIALGKFLGAIGIALAFTALSVAGTVGALTADGTMLGAQLGAVVPAVLAYGALFFALGTVTNWGLIGGLVVLFGWEQALSRVSTVATQVSLRHYADTLAHSLAGEPTSVGAVTSGAVLIGAGIVFVAVAGWRFRTMEFPD